jgi:hypothetical protein
MLIINIIFLKIFPDSPKTIFYDFKGIVDPRKNRVERTWAVANNTDSGAKMEV